MEQPSWARQLELRQQRAEQREAEIRALEEKKTEEEQERQRNKNAVIKQTTSILLEVRDTDPELAPPKAQEKELSCKFGGEAWYKIKDAETLFPEELNDVSSLRLRWGSKLGLTNDEKRILEKFEYLPEETSNLDPEWQTLPDRFNGESYDLLLVDFSYYSFRVNNRNEIKYEDFLQDPSKFLEVLNESVINPAYGTKTFFEKGVSYARKRYRPEPILPWYQRVVRFLAKTPCG